MRRENDAPFFVGNREGFYDGIGSGSHGGGPRPSRFAYRILKNDSLLVHTWPPIKHSSAMSLCAYG